MKKVILSASIFIFGTVLGAYLCDAMLWFLSSEGVKFIYTSITENFFLRLRVAGLFGVLSVVILLGTMTPKGFNGLKRFVIITIPAMVMCGLVLAQRKLLVANDIRIDSLDIQPMISMGGLKLEFVPLAGLIVATVITLVLFKMKKV